MHLQSEVILVLAFAFVVGASCVAGIARFKSQVIHERGLLAFSTLPWVHVIVTSLVAFYVRMGFGSWPRSCIDNPDLPLLGILVSILILGLLIIPFGIPLWLGWFIICHRRRFHRYRIPSAVLFVSGVVMVVVAQKTDPFGFWEWIWD
jgi:hypothetical protein